MTNLEFYKKEIKEMIDKKIEKCSMSASLYDSIITAYTKHTTDNAVYTLFEIIDWLCEEHQILDKEEKEYLSNVIRPIKNNDCIHITKLKWCISSGDYEYIKVKFRDNAVACLVFPLFKKGTMYKGMEVNKEYTLEELGL